MSRPARGPFGGQTISPAALFHQQRQIHASQWLFTAKALPGKEHRDSKIADIYPPFSLLFLFHTFYPILSLGQSDRDGVIR